MSKKKFSGSINGKGYYIALILCAVAIGISGYLYYRNANDAQTELQNQPDASVSATQSDDVQVVATQPGTEDTADNTTATGDETTPSVSKPVKTVSPVAGSTVAVYAMESLTYNQTTRDWRVHDGMDIAAEAGTAVGAAADGTVYSVYEDETMGTTVVIVHDGGYTTKYSSLAQETAVAPGDTVEAGQTIGYVGSSAMLESAIGDHVHFSVTCYGETMDPSEFLESA